jgi:hypothetical protein
MLMGFTHDRAALALTAVQGCVQRAALLLASDGDLDAKTAEALRMLELEEEGAVPPLSPPPAPPTSPPAPPTSPPTPPVRPAQPPTASSGGQACNWPARARAAAGLPARGRCAWPGREVARAQVPALGGALRCSEECRVSLVK